MRRSVLPVLLAALCFVVCTTDAMAMYHPGLGRYMQRDPYGTEMTPGLERANLSFAFRNDEDYGFIPRDRPDPSVQYGDGMNIYVAYRSSPMRFLDSSGMRVKWWTRGHMYNNSSYNVRAGGDYHPHAHWVTIRPGKRNSRREFRKGPAVEWDTVLPPGTHSTTMYSTHGSSLTGYLYDWDFILPTAGVTIYIDEDCEVMANLCDARKKICPNGMKHDGKIKAFHQKTVHDCCSKPNAVYITKGWTDY